MTLDRKGKFYTNLSKSLSAQEAWNTDSISANAGATAPPILQMCQGYLLCLVTCPNPELFGRPSITNTDTTGQNDSHRGEMHRMLQRTWASRTLVLREHHMHGLLPESSLDRSFPGQEVR